MYVRCIIVSLRPDLVAQQVECRGPRCRGEHDPPCEHTAELQFAAYIHLNTRFSSDGGTNVGAQQVAAAAPIPVGFPFCNVTSIMSTTMCYAEFQEGAAVTPNFPSSL